MLFGAPGVGKGTFGKLIEQDFNFPTFSMGDYFRRIANSTSEDPLLKELRETLRSGQFVSDDKAIEVIKNARLFGDYKDTPVLIFDGMPRTVAQAEMLASQSISVDLIVNFTNRDDILLEKLMGRRVCPSCSQNYNVTNIDRDGYLMRPLLP